ncbi:ATP-binding cassette domain-containing protein [Nocardioides sp. J2M5]|uniref:ABC transporter ATP-binding protein n=1 Tax=Nocardioides palaemonis TaxID=2829810 RepID=UPI001BA8126F|nr:ATP-binding cassette domain-containing protein [Nocardioides palaemonis]MBS2936516.1 ATP-binding cassette domain-containing protein [Nocardioides palaemonis]
MRTDTSPPDPVEVARCLGLVRLYPGSTGEVAALRGVDASFSSHSVTALTGPSGSGKSTLLALLAMRDRPDGGTVTVLGHDVASLSGRDRRRLARTGVTWAPQRPTDGLFPHLSAAQNLEQAARWRGAPRAEVGTLLRRLGLEEVADVRASRLSGGEQQRVAVGCACIGSPPLVLCDEPTAELDEDTAALALAALRDAARSGSAVVVATHDPDAVAASDRVVGLRHGVLGTEQAVGATVHAAIDRAGRLQLPPAALTLFPDQRAVVRVEGDRVVLEPPDRTGPADTGGERS